MAEPAKPFFPRIALIGLGLIGSSIAWAAKREGLVGHVAGAARTPETRAKAMELGFCDSVCPARSSRAPRAARRRSLRPSPRR